MINILNHHVRNIHYMQMRELSHMTPEVWKPAKKHMHADTSLAKLVTYS